LIRFWRALRSLKLAIALIAAITLGSILATLIPQGLTPDRYGDLYPRFVSLLINESGLSHYFTSLLFILPVLAFFANLSACTLSRIKRELTKKKSRRHGPDILHVGILVLIVGSLISFSERKEGTATLKKGDTLELPGGKVLTLVSFTDERYSDGRPKDWISVVDISKDGKKFIENRPIRVNAPLRIDGLTLYQASYASEPVLSLTGADGIEHQISRGESFKADPFEVFFMTMEEAVAADGSLGKAVLRVRGLGKSSILKDGIFRVGQEKADLEQYEASIKLTMSTGLQAVVDPGFPAVLAGLILIAFGTTLTFAQKLKEFI